MSQIRFSNNLWEKVVCEILGYGANWKSDRDRFCQSSRWEETFNLSGGLSLGNNHDDQGEDDNHKSQDDQNEDDNHEDDEDQDEDDNHDDQGEDYNYEDHVHHDDCDDHDNKIDLR